ncbi:MAG: hypothetical protein R2940_08865 [Syntrophotaleaceae bacterium]
MAESMETARQRSMERIVEAARHLERILSSTTHPGIENEKSLALDGLKRRVHELDEIEGKREPVGKMEKWQEDMAGPK